MKKTLEKCAEERIKEWLKAPLDPETRNEIKALMEKNPEKANESFSETLQFGTAGMRAIMAIGSNCLNIYTIRQATQGLANYILSQNILAPSVIISYDCRHHSREFALECAKVLAGNKIKVYLYRELRPTPMASWGVRHYRTTAGIMITASHNPPEYNGYKVYWSDGAQVTSPHDTKIMAEVQKLENFDQIKLANENDPLIQWLDEEADRAYLSEILKLRLTPHEDEEKGHWLNILYSPLCGAGKIVVKQALEKAGFTNVSYVKGQEGPDGNFANLRHPDPEGEEARKLGEAQLLSQKADLCLFTDPDSDRLAVSILHEGQVISFTGNELGCLLIDFILEVNKHIPKNSAAVTTIVSTPLFDAILEKHHITPFHVLTGFKYIGEKIHLWETSKPSYSYLFGFEESMGYLYGTHARDKDATIGALLASEMALHLKKQGKTLLHRLYELYSLYGIYREKAISIQLEEGGEKMLKIMAYLRSNTPTSIGKRKVVSVIDYMKGQNDLPKANVLCLELDDHSKIIIRPSGTEPKIKIYGQMRNLKAKCVTKNDINATDKELDRMLDDAKAILHNGSDSRDRS
ncbi:MAG: phospho-sugar mutase [Chlamydiae bacterium]|nr:phospho-sugar mutase [Chlamydiota bacterium]